MKKIFKGLSAYLKDWKNWVTHTLTGMGILAAAYFIPVKPLYRIAILVMVILFNGARMFLSRRKAVPGMEEEMPAGQGDNY